jgi:hypothetical protein
VQISPLSFRQITLNQVLYSDSCNFNNIYVCAIPKISQGSSLKYLMPAQKEIILSNIQPLKPITSEIAFMDPIFKAITFGLKTDDKVILENKSFCRLRLYTTNENRRSIRSIQQDAEKIFLDFFNPVNAKLGGIFDIGLLTSRVLNINGVKQIQTYRSDTEELYEGLSFFMWNPTFPESDKRVITTNTPLLDFEFVFFEELQSIMSKIEVIDKQTFV